MSKEQVLNAIKALDQPATVWRFGKISHILNALTYFVGKVLSRSNQYRYSSHSD